MQKGKAVPDKEKGKLSLFANERHEDLAAIIGAAVVMLLIIIIAG